ncbi:hypothetical protein O3G_MSEX013904 [Manduca sexta]|uniref:non-specific serine/threonine protein kinase n=1 Tax=Manduca sexta TaxID=7130 RepID=A0A922D028_MANSE|nr:hypothetical protein O3G_MSEX013904 [Manduca sexta]KAG6463497.1 hypothetical protein O3G_MSEX013904 [Manduca sexta]KAG6463498.1 hypothetical protein O3G_MSEX013904 [Manduca sexta]KAG6463499.1 hypothetical protein O3G_MSEX013904 [Manduca sexta]KAG6463500.1 hypothetical protein O3G_MSEX013904 [Manduca sexta]
MADRHNRHYKSKTSRHHREDDNHKSKSRKRKLSAESNTPPLPTGASIKELIRERKSLQKKLKKMNIKSDSKIQNRKESSSDRSKKRKNSNDGRTHRKRRNSKHENDSKEKHVKVSVQEISPEHNLDYAQSESEDEESIIEQRRKQRKQLLEKLTISEDVKCNKKIECNLEENKFLESNKPDKSNVQILNSEEKTNDMFSEKDDFADNKFSKEMLNANIDNTIQLNDNCSDSDGYYNIRIGEVIENKYTVKDILGQGVFANVVRAQENGDGNNYVAIKIVRNNDLMYKTGLKEIATLKQINDADPDNKYHCVKFFGSFMHRGHLCLVLESLHMDLRCILKKYGKHHGINLKAITSYSRQLFMAVRLLKKIGIVHADIKPDNILVNEKKNILKLCDFGSSANVSDNEPTPYLVSRFYRAPEIILGLPYKHGIDVWSSACTIYEMTTGKILFTGSSNNKMLKCFMDLKGKIPNRLIKRGKFKDQHFNYNNNFLLHKKDEITGRDKVVETACINPVRELSSELRKSCKYLGDEEDRKLQQLKDLLDKMLMLDSSQRISITDCLKHPFIQEELKK